MPVQHRIDGVPFVNVAFEESQIFVLDAKIGRRAGESLNGVTTL